MTARTGRDFTVLATAVTVSAMSAAQQPSPSGALALRAAFNGADRTFGAMPPDLSIAAGPASVVMATNDGVTIRDKVGSLIAQAELNAFFNSVRPDDRERLIDVSIHYDAANGRFFIGSFAVRKVGSYWLAITVDGGGFRSDLLELNDESSDCSGAALIKLDEAPSLARIAILSRGLIHYPGGTPASYTVRSQKTILEDGSKSLCHSQPFEPDGAVLVAPLGCRESRFGDRTPRVEPITQS